jgi:hypothetical protein
MDFVSMGSWEKCPSGFRMLVVQDVGGCACVGQGTHEDSLYPHSFGYELQPALQDKVYLNLYVRMWMKVG